MKILYGTTNPAKLAAMKEWLSGMDIGLISLTELGREIPPVVEDGETPLENAVKKAKAYYAAFCMPVFSCDSGLYFENLPQFSPKARVRNVGGKCLTDDEMIEYYSGLAAEHGDIIARYRNGICLICDKDMIFTDDSDDLGGETFIITSVPHQRREKGFPLDCLSKRTDGGGYFYDSPVSLEGSMGAGFRRFFENALSPVERV